MLTESDRGRMINVSAAESITVRLVENPTTGFTWTVEAAGGLEPAGDEHEANEAPGASGVRVLRFRPRGPGTYTLRLKHWRPWEGEPSVTDRFEVGVIAT